MKYLFVKTTYRWILCILLLFSTAFSVAASVPQQSQKLTYSTGYGPSHSKRKALSWLCFNQSKLQAARGISACLTPEEKTDLEYFFRILLFENHGAFVLFGSKPLCEMCLRDTESSSADSAFQQWFDSLPVEKQAEFKARMTNKTQEEPELERNPYRGWLALEKVLKTFTMKRYILRIRPLRGPGRYELILANIEQTSLAMTKNYAIFKNTAGMEFNPIQTVLELQNPEAIFWKNIFSSPHHLAKGLLFGFGLRNSLFGDLRFTYATTTMNHLKTPPTPISIHQAKYKKGRRLSFTIPLFRSMEGDHTAEDYEKEKMKIEKIYQGQDLVELTLQRLFSSEF